MFIICTVIYIVHQNVFTSTYEPETHDEFEAHAQFAQRVAAIDDEEAARELKQEHGADLQHNQQVARTQDQVIAMQSIPSRSDVRTHTVAVTSFNYINCMRFISRLKWFEGVGCLKWKCKEELCREERAPVRRRRTAWRSGTRELGAPA